jgi:hypothetical protein
MFSQSSSKKNFSLLGFRGPARDGEAEGRGVAFVLPLALRIDVWEVFGFSFSGLSGRSPFRLSSSHIDIPAVEVDKRLGLPPRLLRGDGVGLPLPRASTSQSGSALASASIDSCGRCESGVDAEILRLLLPNTLSPRLCAINLLSRGKYPPPGPRVPCCMPYGLEKSF